MSGIRRFAADPNGDFRWEAVDALRYKDEGSAHFRDVARQVLFSPADQACELRYFEIAPPLWRSWYAWLAYVLTTALVIWK